MSPASRPAAARTASATAWSTSTTATRCQGETSAPPDDLTQGELEPFFNDAWSIFDVLEMNFRYGGYDPDELRDFVVGVESQLYPQMGKLYKRRIEAAAR
jgi:hypothetical protein